MPANSPHFRKQFRAELWLYPGKAGWHFVTLPRKLSGEIQRRFGSMGNAWSSLRVTAEIGGSRWETSIFRDSKLKAYVLPIKSAIRKAERLETGLRLKVQIELNEIPFETSFP